MPRPDPTTPMIRGPEPTPSSAGRIGAALGLLGGLLPAVAHADDPRAVLLGNSYTDFNELDQRVAELARTSVPAWGALTAERLTSGGLTLNDHLGRARSERADNRWWTRFGAGSPPAALVTLQDQSQVPGFPESHPFWVADAAAVGELADIAARLGAQTFLLATWGRRDGDDGNPDLYPDFLTMNDRLDAGYRRYAELNDRPDRPIYVAPAGRAFAQVYADVIAAGGDPLATDSAFFGLYNGDGSHPEREASALVAGVIVTAATGWSPRWLSAPPSLSLSDVAPWVGVVEAVVVPDGDLRYPWAFAWGASETDAPLGGASRVISHPLRLETEVAPTGTTVVADLQLGGQHPSGEAGAGRLWVPAGARVEASGLRLGDVEGASGEVVINDGDAALGEVVGAAGRARVRVRGGSATVTALRLTEGDPRQVFDYAVELSGGALSLGAAPSLRQTGGALSGAGAPAALDTYAFTGGAIAVDASRPTATAGRWTAEGPLELRLTGGCSADMPSQVVVEAAVCVLGDLLPTAPAGCVARVESRSDGGCSLVIGGDAAPADSGEPTPEPGADGGDGTVDSGPTVDAQDSGLKIVAIDDGAGCGCAGAGARRGRAAFFGLGGLGMLLALRRRRDQ